MEISRRVLYNTIKTQEGIVKVTYNFKYVVKIGFCNMAGVVFNLQLYSNFYKKT